jgi:hypothetical protein
MSFSHAQDEPKFLKFKEQMPNAEKMQRSSWNIAGRMMGWTGTSSGAVAAIHFQTIYDNVYIYGFDFFQGSKHHYGDTVSAGNLHRGQHEAFMFRTLMTQGKVIPFQDYYPTPPNQYKELHENSTGYDTGGNYFAPTILELADRHGCKSILDFGCGKGGLMRRLTRDRSDLTVWGYDPFSPNEQITEMPTRDFDMVVSTDMLEHVEEDDVPCVLGQMALMRSKVMLLVVSNRWAHQFLPDGNNAHATVKPLEWWQVKIAECTKAREVNVLRYDKRNKFTVFEVIK